MPIGVAGMREEKTNRIERYIDGQHVAPRPAGLRVDVEGSLQAGCERGRPEEHLRILAIRRHAQ